MILLKKNLSIVEFRPKYVRKLFNFWVRQLKRFLNSNRAQNHVIRTKIKLIFPYFMWFWSAEMWSAEFSMDNITFPQKLQTKLIWDDKCVYIIEQFEITCVQIRLWKKSRILSFEKCTIDHFASNRRQAVETDIAHEFIVLEPDPFHVSVERIKSTIVCRISNTFA